MRAFLVRTSSSLKTAGLILVGQSLSRSKSSIRRLRSHSTETDGGASAASAMLAPGGLELYLYIPSNNKIVLQQNYVEK